MRSFLSFALCFAALASCGGPEDGTQTPSDSNSAAEQASASGSTSPPVQLDGELRNVLLVTFDTTRADHIASYGSPFSSTPVLDSLAQNGVRFEDCIATAPITLPSHSSIFTGQYPPTHGVRNNGTHKLPEEAVTLAEVLHDQGFETGAVISAMVLNARFGLSQGFDHYDQNLVAGSNTNVYLARETPAADTIRRAKEWVEQRGDKPFFLWVHLFDPHHPYTPPPGYAERCNGNPYDGEIAYADEQLGVLLDALRQKELLRHTLVVATGDHGESLGEHGESTHSIFLYDSCTRVPLIFSHSKLQQNAVRSPVVSHVDVAPTILELLGQPPLEESIGVSLAKQLLLDSADPSLESMNQALAGRVVYSESMLPYYNFGWSDLRSLRSLDARYIRAPKEELYALVADPGEQVNMFEESPDAAVFQRLMDEMLAGGEKNAQFSDFENLPAAERAALIALGYLGNTQGAEADGNSTDSDGNSQIGDKDRMDPKDAVLYFEEQVDAIDLARRRQPEAEAALRAVLEDNPGEMSCQSALADLLVRNGRFEEALPYCITLAGLKGAGAMEILALSIVERRLNLPEWEGHYAAARAVDPEDPAPLISLGTWEAELKNWDQAVSFFQEALDLDPGNLQALIQMGVTHSLAGQLSQAQGVLEQALQINPEIYRLQLQLGLVSDRLGQYEQAAAYLKRATELGPGRRQAWRHYGSTLLRINRHRLALVAFQQAARLGDNSLVTSKNLGLLQIGFKNFATAVKPFQRVLKLDPNDFQSHFYLAWALDVQGNSKMAASHLAEARRISMDEVNRQAAQNPELAALLKKYP